MSDILSLNKNDVYLDSHRLKLYNSDFLEINIDKSSIDLIITSPPYNLDIKYSSYQDKVTYDEYLIFTKKYLQKCYDLLKNDGRICLNVPLDKNKGGQQSVYADIVRICKSVDLKYHSTIIWNEQNISRRTAWGSWLSASAPFVIAPVETIIVMYKEAWKKVSGSRISDINKQDFMDWTNGFWTFKGESKKKIGHPAPFPIELPKRCMKLFSYVDDLILDPFLGSGSTAISCLKTERQCIGVEIDPMYCEISKNRIIKEGGLGQTKLD